MYMYVCIYIYIYIYMYMYVCIYIHTYNIKTKSTVDFKKANDRHIQDAVSHIFGIIFSNFQPLTFFAKKSTKDVLTAFLNAMMYVSTPVSKR